MRIRYFSTLPEEARAIRAAVFIDEQGFTDDVDEMDDYATHAVLYKEDRPVAACRFFEIPEGKGRFRIGHIAVMKEYRKRGYGSTLVSLVESEIKERGGEELVLHAQCQAAGFYEKLGYCCSGEIEPGERFSHVWMIKRL